MQTMTHNIRGSSSEDIGSSIRHRKVAFIMSRFPKLTETFILFEMKTLEDLGVAIEVFPLLRARNTGTHPEGAGILKKLFELMRAPAAETVMHDAAKPFVRRAHFAPFMNMAILLAQFSFGFRKPLAYVSVFWSLIRFNWGSLNFLLGTLSTFPKCVYFAKLMEQEQITHIHAHFANHPAAAAYVIHKLTGIPYSFTAHGADFQVDQHMLKEKVSSAKHVVTISNYNKHFFVELCGESFSEKIKVVRCGVDTIVFQAGDSGATPDATALKIVCTGTFYEVKGHRYLIEACSILQKAGTEFECSLIGTGPIEDELKSLVHNAGLDGRVLFVGRKTRDEVAEMLQNSDILVAPSIPTKSGRREGIPVVLMEAMACEVPVVASRISGIPELVDHEENGILVPPANPEVLANAIQFLIDTPGARRQYGIAARRKILREYDLEHNAKRLSELFSSVEASC